MLRPILTRFVRAFDGEPDIDFWSRVCHYNFQGSGASYLSGWITAFCVWSSNGEWQGPPISKPSKKRTINLFSGETVPELVLDKVSYPIIESGVPVGFCEVDVKMDDNGVMLSCMMVSGHFAYSVEGEKKDTIRPRPSWFMIVKGEPEVSEEEKGKMFVKGYGDPQAREDEEVKKNKKEKKKLCGTCIIL